MKNAGNTFRDALRAGQTQIGLWVGLVDANTTELLAGCGFDWLLFDCEHAPNDVRTTLDQLRAVAPYRPQAIVRPVQAGVALVKQYLDVGAQTLLIPMIDTVEQARMMVRAMRYPPEGIRGMGAALARASRWNQVQNYVDGANDEMCLLVQAETLEAMRYLEDIAAVEGVDGVFFGPADLSASMGHRGQANHEAVHHRIIDGIKLVRDAGKAAGVLVSDRQAGQTYLDAGAQFVAGGVDTTLLIRAATALAGSYKTPGAKGGEIPVSSGSAY
ncbi:2,4-dihydroxyhept-2-enedioate aldolase [Paraburkholderia sp. BL23I1N1]|uniref:aldolase/citrate lyase family protein n=1 Tax=Paraburkholderia sp. BL23I1N1 TaxID=1938802 RepID=UPI000E73C966|nr:aldolase/citrate lyase family protein [Paraburkholderia sp. BL23I1N1]RKE38657.1 2,4-dihydroxyhept-2-enedioate aldolase [Paraburkholderia sp. BL23I1N1]